MKWFKDVLLQTEEILTELSLSELKLQTTISQEEYIACKMHFEKDPAQGNSFNNSSFCDIWWPHG